jgi:C1A family cysteine protease
MLQDKENPSGIKKLLMQLWFILSVLMMSVLPTAQASLPDRYLELIPYVQPAPDQGETNTCWFMASTGVMELLLNKKNNIRRPKAYGPYDLSESFLIYQKDYYDSGDPQEHFIEEVVARWNWGEAVLAKDWPIELGPDKAATDHVWWKNPDFWNLPRIKIPQIKSELLFARGKRYATDVLLPEDIILLKKTMSERHAPIIINYNEDGYWHVILIVGYNDRARGQCYEIEKEDCNKRGAFAVRDSDGKRIEWRAYNWFLKNGNAAAVVELK